MNAVKSIVATPENRIIQLRVPESVPINEPVEVILLYGEQNNSYQSKINQLSQALKDKLFIEDLNEISSDFH